MYSLVAQDRVAHLPEMPALEEVLLFKQNGHVCRMEMLQMN